MPKGHTNNPNGRPDKKRALADLMRKKLDEEIDGIPLKTLIVDRAINALNTGYLKFMGKAKPLKLTPKDWIDLYKFTNTHIDGPVKTEVELSGSAHNGAVKNFVLPADVIAPSFLDAYRDIAGKLHTEYVFRGGRGSTKS